MKLIQFRVPLEILFILNRFYAINVQIILTASLIYLANFLGQQYFAVMCS